MGFDFCTSSDFAKKADLGFWIPFWAAAMSLVWPCGARGPTGARLLLATVASRLARPGPGPEPPMAMADAPPQPGPPPSKTHGFLDLVIHPALPHPDATPGIALSAAAHSKLSQHSESDHVSSNQTSLTSCDAIVPVRQRHPCSCFCRNIVLASAGANVGVAAASARAVLAQP